MLCVLDEAGRIERWGERGSELTKLSAAATEGKQFSEVVVGGTEDMQEHAHGVVRPWRQPVAKSQAPDARASAEFSPPHDLYFVLILYTLYFMRSSPRRTRTPTGCAGHSRRTPNPAAPRPRIILYTVYFILDSPKPRRL